MAPSDDPIDAWVAAGLLDPTSPDADSQSDLLNWIASFGITIEQMVKAKSSGHLDALPGAMALRPGPYSSLRDIASLLGSPLESLIDIRRATGLPPVDPDEAAFTTSDITMFRAFNDAAALFSRDELLHFSRVLGTSLRRIAEAAGEMFILDVEAPLAADSEVSLLMLARQGYEAILMTDAATAVFEPLFRAQLEQSFHTSRLTRADAPRDPMVSVAVGFVDLTGFTSQSQHLSSEQLLALVLTFEADACDLVADHGGRVIKLIGDEVMFTAVDAQSACAITLGLLEKVGPRDAPQPRGGLAFGPVIAHGGDLYGDTVNRASRMADIAIPGEVLIDAGIKSRANSFSAAQAGRRLLKGFAEPIEVWSLSVATGHQ